MNTQLVFKSVLIALGLFLASRSEAGCQNMYQTDYYGNQRIVQVCDNSMDLPAMNLPNVGDLTAPRGGVAPLPSGNLPPLGTQSCRVVFVGGQYREVCQ